MSYTLYTAGTTNGWKASITLEELGLEYKVHPISFSKNDQKTDWFLKINPNGRIPAIVDHEEGDLPVFESGALMIHLAEKDPSGLLLPQDRRKKAEVLSWLMFQMAGVGPMQGQAAHFLRFAPEKIPYAINRYKNETERLYQVMEDHLAGGRQWLAAEQYTIADIANFCWVYGHGFSGLTLDNKPHLKSWMDRIAQRPAVQRGLDIPEPNMIKKVAEDPSLAEQLVRDAQKMMVSHQEEGSPAKANTA